MRRSTRTTTKKVPSRSSSSKKAPSRSSSSKSSLSAYEIARHKQIAENQKIMGQLGLKQAANKIRTSASMNTRKRKPTTKGVKKKKKPRGPPAPARRSLRVQGKTSTGESLPADFRTIPQNGGTTSRVHERWEADQKLKGDVLVGDGASFLKELLASDNNSSRSSSKSKTNSKSNTSSNSVADVAQILSNLSVDEEHGVRKVTPERIYSLALMPSSASVVVAAGDKKGNVGIWNVGSSDVDDGVFSMRITGSCISHLSFSKTNSSKLLAASYDGSLKVLDAEKGVFSELLHLEDRCLYEFDSTEDMSTTFLADDEGDVHQIDLRVNARNRVINYFTAHDKKINTLRINPTRPWLLATASLDRSVKLWDIRRMSKSSSSSSSTSTSSASSSTCKPIYTLNHELAVSSAVFSPDGTQMLSNGCGPNHVKIYDIQTLLGSYEASSMKKTMPMAQPKEKFHHVNKTGRWLTRFKPSFDPKRNGVFVMGCMDQPRCIEIFHSPPGPETGVRAIMRLRDDLVNSVQSLNEFHISKELIASANSSGRVSIWSL